MNAMKQKITDFIKSLKFIFQRKIFIILKLFELKQFMIHTFFDKVIPTCENRIKNQVFHFAEKSGN